MKAIIWREIRVSIQNIFSLVSQFIVPIFFLVFFATIFASNFGRLSFGGLEVDYIRFFAPGLFGYVTFLLFALSFTYIKIDKQTGMMAIITLSKSSLEGYFFGKLLVQIFLSFCKIIVLVSLTIILSGVFPTMAPVCIVVFCVTLTLGTIIWFSLGLIGGVYIQRDDIREVLMLLITLPITFASSMYYDVNKAHSFIQNIATVNPLTYICNLLRGSYLDRLPPDYLYQLLFLAGLSCFLLFLGVYSIRRVKL
ncbi:MAG: ABC transporter permease [Candidatus Zixiibacteriota bacterium]